MSRGMSALPAAPPPQTPALRRVAVEAVGYHLAERAPEAAGRRAPLLLGLHGYAQSADMFLPIMRKLAPPDFAAAAAQGFNQIWDPSSRKISFSWLTAYEKQDSIDRNNRFLAGVIDDLAADGTADPGAVFLLGFSQGASVAYRFAQRFPSRVRGIISACADLPPDVEADLAPLRQTPIFITYGLQDRIVAEAKPLHAIDALRTGGLEVEVASFDRGHLIPSSIAPKVHDWMRRNLQTRPWPGQAMCP